MDRLLARLDRRFGRFAIPNLTSYLAGGMGVVFLLTLLRPTFLAAIFFEPHLVLRGEVWRVFTFLFIPSTFKIFWILFEVYWIWFVGRALESEWGAFKLNCFYFFGAILTIGSAFVVGAPTTSEFLGMSLTFAFATLFPNQQIMLFFFPMRVKWLAAISGAFLGYQFYKGDLPIRVAIGVSIVNYLLFFAPTLIRGLRGVALVERQARERRVRETDRPVRAVRTCVICGKTDEDENADLRVCNCEAVCKGKATIYCLEHARSHNKVAAS